MFCVTQGTHISGTSRGAPPLTAQGAAEVATGLYNVILFLFFDVSRTCRTRMSELLFVLPETIRDYVSYLPFRLCICQIVRPALSYRSFVRVLA